MNIFHLIHNSKDIMNQAARDSQLLFKMDEETRRQLQRCLLDMYKDVQQVCEKYRLTLFLVGGSALGAVRHQGFIPWDDDLDLGMSRKDYETFKNIFSKELSEKYILNAPNYSNNAKNRFPRILKKDSYYRSIIDSQDDTLHRIFLDLFILENTPDNRVHRYLKGNRCNLLGLIGRSVFIRENCTPEMKTFLLMSGKMNYYLRFIVGSVFSFRNSARWFDKADQVAQYANNDSRECCIATGRKRYFGEIMKREQWFPGTSARFEGEDVTIFNDYDPYLRNLYGDYMELPPENKRELHTVCEIRFSLD